MRLLGGMMASLVCGLIVQAGYIDNLDGVNINSWRSPDNSPVPDSIVGKASGFILLIEKAINPSVMETKSI